MAPAKNNTPTTSRKTRSSGSTAMRQGTLSFASVKRTASGTSAKGKKPVATRTLSGSVVEESRDDSSSGDESSEMDEVELAAFKKRKAANEKAVRAARVESEKEEVEEVAREELDLKDRKGRWRKHYGVVRDKMGHIPPIHGQGQTKIHEILRVFDLEYEYGPCVGVTRLERWERASALGLNPPPEVREILMTKQGTEEIQFRECVFYGEEV